MPMQFGKMTIETPQEVLARITQQRQAMAASGSYAAVNQATTSNALDALFGNPEVQQAQKIQSRLQSATSGMKPVEGDDDVTAEMRRVSAMRDAVQDVDPGLANEMTTQLLQLGTIKTERQKLLAQQKLAENKDQRGAAMDVLRAANIQSELDARAQDMQKQAGDSTNYWKRVGSSIKHIAVSDSDSLQRKALIGQGWVEGTGPTSEAEANSIVGEKPTKPVMTDLQTNLLGARDQLDGISRIAQKFEPDFLTLPNKMMMKGVQAADALGLGGAVPPDLMGKYERFTEFRANSIDAFNRYIKYMTGAQMAVAEAQRIQKGFMDAENDGPHSFVAKMRSTARQVLGVEKRSAEVVRQGIPVTPEDMKSCQEGGPCKFDSIKTPTVSEEEVDQFLTRFGIPPRAKAPAKAGAVDQDGWQTMQSGARIRKVK